MSGITNWSEALAHPCFWALHYYTLFSNTDKPEAFFDCSDEQNDEFFLLLHGDVKELDRLPDEDEDEDAERPVPPEADDTYDDYAEYMYTPPTSVLALSFPENYTWALEFGFGDVEHHIYHPKAPPWDFHRLVADDGPNCSLPGLRWAEVKQMVACLQPTWPGPFDLQALYLLLYPIVDPVTGDEYEEVRQTLGTTWKDLQVMKPSQLERWLDVSISVFEKGWTFRYAAAHGWQEDDPPASAGPEQLWFPDPAGHWFCMRHNCPRSKGDHERFTPFFDMLDRHTQPHT